MTSAELHAYRIVRHKVDSTIDIIEQTMSGDFPHLAPLNALAVLKQFFEDSRKDIDDRYLQYQNGISTPDDLRDECARLTTWVYEIGQLIGFILRSTNVRNSFEWFWPLQRLVDKIFAAGGQTQRKQVVISSEWNFYPHTHLFSVNESGLQRLTDFVFVGLPAYEARNPLIIPLAGHEIGHAIWRSKRLLDVLEPRLSNDIAIIASQVMPSIPFTPATQKQLIAYCLRQCEEMFCDFMGLVLFGVSYLHAFSYFVSPIEQTRVPYYPSVYQRGEYVHWFAARRGWALDNYVANFAADPPLSGADNPIVVIDAARNEAKELVEKLALEAAADKEVIYVESTKGSSILEAFRSGRPASDPERFAAIVDAGWQYFLANPSLTNAEFEHLSHMMLKTVEILEFNLRTRS